MRPGSGLSKGDLVATRPPLVGEFSPYAGPVSPLMSRAPILLNPKP